jgi:parallel beta-helix repeat protein
MIAVCALLSIGAQGEGDDDWLISDHVILEDETIVIARNISIVAGGWLDLRGTSITVNNTIPGEHMIRIFDEGRLTTDRSRSGTDCFIGPIDSDNPTGIYANWATGISLEHLMMDDCGFVIYGTPNEIHPAIEIDNTDTVVVRNSEFKGNLRTLDLATCSEITIENNLIVNSTGAAIYLLSSSDASISDNRIEGGTIGINVMLTTDLTIRNNDVLSDFLGIQVSRSDGMKITGNTIQVSGFRGCSLFSSKLITIERNSFTGITKIYPFNFGTMLEDCSFVTIREDNYSNLTYAIEILNSDRFGSAHNHISSVEIVNCSVGLHIASAKNIVSDSTILDSGTGILIDDQYTDFIEANPVGNSVLGCYIKSCDSGVQVVNSTDTKLVSNTYDVNMNDIVSTSSSGTVEENGTHQGWGNSALTVHGGDLEASFTSLSNGGSAIIQGGGSVVHLIQSTVNNVTITVLSDSGGRMVLVNTTHPRIYELDATSFVEVHWDVEINVELASKPKRRLAGSISIADNSNSSVYAEDFNMTDGHVGVVIQELVIQGEEVQNYTPHTFLANVDDLDASLISNITGFTRITILIDDIPPVIEVLSPLPGEHNSSALLLSGNASDGHSTLVSIEVIVDGATIWNGNDRWDITHTFQDGPHTITVIVEDNKGNQADTKYNITVDTTPPTIKIIHPPSLDHRTRGPNITIIGSIKDAFELSINNTPVDFDLGQFQSTAILPADGTFTFEVRAIDHLGNAVSVFLTIERDSTAPLLVVGEFPNRTRMPTIEVMGRTEVNRSTVTLDGEIVSTSSDGSFILNLSLKEGMNSFSLMVTDDLDNYCSTRVDIVLDTIADIDIIAPLNGTRSQVQDIQVIVQVEPGSMVKVDDGDWYTANEQGYLSIDIILRTSTNDLVVVTEDVLGNEATVQLRVHYEPPLHTEEENWFLVLVIIIGIAIAVLLAYKYVMRGPAGGSEDAS